MYLLKFLHQTTTISFALSVAKGCIFSSSYIKPQRPWRPFIVWAGCIFSSSYIKPQLKYYYYLYISVVSSQVPTSNHNRESEGLDVVGLYLLKFLHQTTTVRPRRPGKCCCIFSSSYIKPQLDPGVICKRVGLYLLKFLHQTTTICGRGMPPTKLYLLKFLHQTTTRARQGTGMHQLYLLKFLHQTTTRA